MGYDTYFTESVNWKTLIVTLGQLVYKEYIYFSKDRCVK